MSSGKSDKYHREIVIALVLTFLMALGAFFFSKMTFLDVSNILEGKDAPEIQYLGANERTNRLSDQKGVVVLVNFWAIWCEECMKQLNGLRQIENHFSQKGFLLLAFNMGDPGDSIRINMDGQDYPKNLIMNFSKQNIDAYGIKGLPMSVLIDKKGIVKKVYRGKMNWMDGRVISEIDNLLR